MRQVIHFKSGAERIAFIKGELEEIVPKKAEKVKKEDITSENEKKSRQKEEKSPKPKKSAKKGAKKDEVSAE